MKLDWTWKPFPRSGIREILIGVITEWASSDWQRRLRHRLQQRWFTTSSSSRVVAREHGERLIVGIHYSLKQKLAALMWRRWLQIQMILQLHRHLFPLRQLSHQISQVRIRWKILHFLSSFVSDIMQLRKRMYFFCIINKFIDDKNMKWWRGVYTHIYNKCSNIGFES